MYRTAVDLDASGIPEERLGVLEGLIETWVPCVTRATETFALTARADIGGSRYPVLPDEQCSDLVRGVLAEYGF